MNDIFGKGQEDMMFNMAYVFICPCFFKTVWSLVLSIFSDWFAVADVNRHSLRLPAGHGCLKGKHSAKRSEVFLCFRLTFPLNRQVMLLVVNRTSFGPLTATDNIYSLAVYEIE